jgi:phosphate binding protein
MMRKQLALWTLAVGILIGCGEAPKAPAPAAPPAATAGHDGAAAETAPTDIPMPAGAGDSTGASAAAVLPSPETIKSGTYAPLSRPLFIYVNKKSLANKPEVALYVHHFLNEGQSAVAEVGYVPLAEDDLKASQAALAEGGVTAAPAGDVSGKVVIDGSSTVFPLSAAVAKQVETKTGEKVKVEVGRSGTGGGFKKFVIGETDISGASRPIDAKEIEAAAKGGVEYIGMKVAIDGICIVVNPENDWLTSISVEDLKKMWEPNSSAKTWKDVNPAWPDKELQLYGADTDSGTFDFFTEVINGKSKQSRTEYTASGDDNTLVTGVRDNKYALGYIPFAYYEENKDSLKVVGVIPAAKKE